jgi:hypothetical protein
MANQLKIPANSRHLLNRVPRAGPAIPVWAMKGEFAADKMGFRGTAIHAV